MRRRESARAVAPAVDELSQRVLARAETPEERSRAEEALRDVAAGRELQELAAIKLRRGIFALRESGVSQREIARLVGISQPEVSRRLQRRELHPGEPGPHEVILARKAGEIDTEEMLTRLREMRMTTRVPGRRGAYDAAASATGTARQLMAALRAGQISESEYEAIREASARHRR